MKKSIFLSFLSFLLACNCLYAHGIRVQTELHPPFVLINAGFSATSMLIDARVEVFAPETASAFQIGRTDTRGNFVFYPERQGEWKVIVDDERGHKRTVNVQIDALFFSMSSNSGEDVKVADVDTLCAHAEAYHDDHHHHHHAHDGHMSMIYKIILGLALIFGITGIFYGIKSRRTQ